MVSASAPNADAVQPSTRKTADVAIRVAIVIPEMGLAELPIRPVMRDDTVTNRNPKITTKMAATRLAHPTVRSRNRLEGEEGPHRRNDGHRARQGHANTEIVFRAQGVPRCRRPLARSFSPGAQCRRRWSESF